MFLSGWPSLLAVLMMSLISCSAAENMSWREDVSVELSLSLENDSLMVNICFINEGSRSATLSQELLGVSGKIASPHFSVVDVLDNSSAKFIGPQASSGGVDGTGSFVLKAFGKQCGVMDLSRGYVLLKGHEYEVQYIASDADISANEIISLLSNKKRVKYLK